MGTIANSRLLCPHLLPPGKGQKLESTAVTKAQTKQKKFKNSKKEPEKSRAERLSDKFCL